MQRAGYPLWHRLLAVGLLLAGGTAFVVIQLRDSAPHWPAFALGMAIGATLVGVGVATERHTGDWLDRHHVAAAVFPGALAVTLVNAPFGPAARHGIDGAAAAWSLVVAVWIGLTQLRRAPRRRAIQWQR